MTLFARLLHILNVTDFPFGADQHRNPPMTPAEHANLEMVDRLIAGEALWSRPLIEAFRQTPRHRFLDRVYQPGRDGTWRETDVREPDAAELAIVYSDRALTTRLSSDAAGEDRLPISSSSQPSLMAQMLEDLQLAPGHRVLEIGAGTGYNAALIAHAVGPGNVLTMEVDRAVLTEAAQHLAAFSERQIRLWSGDGRSGCPEEAPFDRIMVTASTADLEPAWLEQLAPGGRLVAPLALAPGLSFVACGEVTGSVFRGGLTRTAFFMPLRAEHESGASGAGLVDTGPLEAIPSPWANWAGQRRLRLGIRGLLLSLALYGFLRGNSVSYRSQDEETQYGLSDLVRGCTCWIGSSQWHASGPDGRALGENLWRAFLDAGAPRPTEYELTAVARGSPGAVGPDAFARRGPRCRQLWKIRESRDRPGLF
jgi:protein-L-isoaspartate(D-aspartate) O-methyltransferase